MSATWIVLILIILEVLYEPEHSDCRRSEEMS